MTDDILANPLHEFSLPHPDSVAPDVTVPIGVATSCAADGRAEHVLQRVDRALYQARQRGRAWMAAGDAVDVRQIAPQRPVEEKPAGATTTARPTGGAPTTRMVRLTTDEPM